MIRRVLACTERVEAALVAHNLTRGGRPVRWLFASDYTVRMTNASPEITSEIYSLIPPY